MVEGPWGPEGLQGMGPSLPAPLQSTPRNEQETDCLGSSHRHSGAAVAASAQRSRMTWAGRQGQQLVPVDSCCHVLGRASSHRADMASAPGSVNFSPVRPWSSGGSSELPLFPLAKRDPEELPRQ